MPELSISVHRLRGYQTATDMSFLRMNSVCRNNHLMALNALSQNRIIGALVRTMDFAQRYTAVVDFAELDRARFVLDRTHAFVDPKRGGCGGYSLDATKARHPRGRDAALSGAPAIQALDPTSVAHLLLGRAKTVSELHLFGRLRMLSVRKQIPQIAVNVRTLRRTTESSEATALPWAQGAPVRILPPRPIFSALSESGAGQKLARRTSNF